MQISFESVTKFYPGPNGDRFLALSPTTFIIESGEFFSVIGPSGCGKSTLLNLLAGLEVIDGGKITVGGELVKRPGPDRAVVFQEHGLMPWMTVQKNIEYGLKLKGLSPADRAERARHFLRMVHLTRFADSMPHQLSGGMRQRVAIARALALEPKVLLMDEPFSALDSQTRDVLHDELQRIWQETKTTIFFITHNLNEAVLLSDRVMIMTSSPGSIKRIIKVPFAHPRSKTATDLVLFTTELHEEIRAEVDRVAAKQLDPDWKKDLPPRRDPASVGPGEGI